MRSTQAQLLAEARFPAAGSPAPCAVSGGADSLTLLVLAVAAGCQVSAHHVDHGLRPESSDEAEIVADAAQMLSVPFTTVRAEVEAGPNLEARARVARYAALPNGVLTGHTADDQAETVLLNLMRGAGLTGLAGIRDDGRRPLLRLRRHQTRALCEDLGLKFVDDPSNRDPSFRRNRVRHEVLPLLDRVADRDVAAVLARQAALLAADDQLLDELAGAVDPTDARAVAAAPEALARRALRAWLRSDQGDHPPDVAAIERVLAVARGEVKACEVADVGRVVRSGGRLSVEPL